MVAGPSLFRWHLVFLKQIWDKKLERWKLYPSSLGGQAKARLHSSGTTYSKNLFCCIGKNGFLTVVEFHLFRIWCNFPVPPETLFRATMFKPISSVHPLWSGDKDTQDSCVVRWDSVCKHLEGCLLLLSSCLSLKSCALTNIGNHFSTACHFLPNEVFMEEWFPGLQGTWVSRAGSESAVVLQSLRFNLFMLWLLVAD